MIEDKSKFINFLSFVAFVLIALLEVLSVVDIFSQTVINVLTTVKNISILFVIGISAYRFVKEKTKTYKIIYWVAFAVFVCATVLMWINL